MFQINSEKQNYHHTNQSSTQMAASFVTPCSSSSSAENFSDCIQTPGTSGLTQNSPYLQYSQRYYSQSFNQNYLYPYHPIEYSSNLYCSPLLSSSISMSNVHQLSPSSTVSGYTNKKSLNTGNILLAKHLTFNSNYQNHLQQQYVKNNLNSAKNLSLINNSIQVAQTPAIVSSITDFSNKFGYLQNRKFDYHQHQYLHQNSKGLNCCKTRKKLQ